MARLIGMAFLIGLIPTPTLVAGEPQRRPEKPPPAEARDLMRAASLHLRTTSKPAGVEFEILRVLDDMGLVLSTPTDALPALEEFISALIKERDRLNKDHQQEPSTLLQIEKVKGELAGAYLKYGEISRKLAHNRKPAQIGKRPEPVGFLPSIARRSDQGVTTDLAPFLDASTVAEIKLVMPSSNDRKHRHALSPPSSSDVILFEEAADLEEQVKAAVKLGRESDALNLLEKLVVVLRQRRDVLAALHRQHAMNLVELARVQDALGRVHLDRGLLGQVVHARSRVARLGAETAAGRATQADLAAARDRLAAAKARLAAEGILCRR